MSGGSFNYLCYAESDNIAEKTEDLQYMADQLAALGYASDAALIFSEVDFTINVNCSDLIFKNGF